MSAGGHEILSVGGPEMKTRARLQVEPAIAEDADCAGVSALMEEPVPSGRTH
jgi:hypothetical protein